MPSRTSRHGECSAKKAAVTELRWTSTPACSKRSSGYSSLRPMNKPPDQANNQPDERQECGSGEARPELDQETGQRAWCGGAGGHRRITLTRTVKERSMLSCSPSKIYEPRLTGVSPRPTDRRQHQKLRNTRGLAATLRQPGSQGR